MSYAQVVREGKNNTIQQGIARHPQPEERGKEGDSPNKQTVAEKQAISRNSNANKFFVFPQFVLFVSSSTTCTQAKYSFGCSSIPLKFDRQFGCGNNVFPWSREGSETLKLGLLPLPNIKGRHRPPQTDSASAAAPFFGHENTKEGEAVAN